MIEISPAILTKDKAEFLKLIEKYKNLKSIDIDLISFNMVDHETLKVSDIINDIPVIEGQSIGFDFMDADPREELVEISKFEIRNSNLRIYIHQEINLTFLNDFEVPANWMMGTSVKIESELLGLDFYNNFPEVQFMSIPIGWQGSQFNPRVLEKIDKLREMGYTGKISIDGSINLETAKLLKGHDINRVSVGSYFTKSENVEGDYKKLFDVLNS